MHGSIFVNFNIFNLLFLCAAVEVSSVTNSLVLLTTVEGEINHKFFGATAMEGEILP